jgi:ATP synthase F1 delta subunit
MANAYNLQTIISRYAKAYYMVYKDRVTLENRNTMIAISKLLERDRSFLILINNTLKDYIDLKVSIFGDYLKIYNLDLPFVQLIRLLLTHARLMLLPQILQGIVNLYDIEKEIAIFHITTPTLISQEGKTAISSFLGSATKKTIFCNYAIDASLVAGFRAQSKEFLYENSVRKKLQTLTHLID